MKKFILAAALSATAMIGMPVAAQTISTTPNGSAIGSFGPMSSPTYGQVFTAPVTGTMTSFTMSLNSGVGQLYGGVGTWNGSASFGLGYGSPVTLFQSDNVASDGAQSYTFTPNINVTAGERYVAYLSVWGLEGAFGDATMPTANNTEFTNYFVWNNSGDPRGDASWDYFGNYGPAAAFSASFAETPAVPEPATWAMMILGMGAVGYALRRAKRRSDVKFDAKIKRMTAGVLA